VDVMLVEQVEDHAVLLPSVVRDEHSIPVGAPLDVGLVWTLPRWCADVPYRERAISTLRSA
jgi:hypothetical protein